MPAWRWWSPASPARPPGPRRGSSAPGPASRSRSPATRSRSTRSTRCSGPDYTATRADMRLLRDGREIAELHPEKRFYPVENGTATEVAIRTNLLSDLYAVIGDPDGKGGYVAAPLLQPAGAVDLARRGGDGARRPRVADRPAPPGRRPGAARGASCRGARSRPRNDATGARLRRGWLYLLPVGVVRCCWRRVLCRARHRLRTCCRRR